MSRRLHLISSADGKVPVQRDHAKKSVADRLLDAEWMQRLPESIRARVIGEAQEAFHAPGEMVARRGEAVQSWIGLAEGLLKVSATTATGRSLMFTGVPEGCWLGEGSLLKNEMRRYDVVALRASRTIHIPRSTFVWLLDVNLEFNHFIIRQLNERVGQFVAAFETSRMPDPIAKVAGAICGLFNPVLYPGASQFLRFSQEELGELAGLARATTNAAIKKLEKHGVVRTAYGGLFVDRVDVLHEIRDAAGEINNPPIARQRTGGASSPR